MKSTESEVKQHVMKGSGNWLIGIVQLSMPSRSFRLVSVILSLDSLPKVLSLKIPLSQ